jgi:hypothetical protein
MRSLERWTLPPDDYDGTLHEFVAGAATVTESHVFTLAGPDGGIEPLFMLVAVPPEASDLTKLVERHTSGAAEGIRYLVRWCLLEPTEDEPCVLARLDLRFDKPSIPETRLLFDAVVHREALWAAHHSHCIALARPEHMPARSEIYTQPDDFPPALVIEADAPLPANVLVRLGLADPFTRRAAGRSPA